MPLHSHGAGKRWTRAARPARSSAGAGPAGSACVCTAPYHMQNMCIHLLMDVDTIAAVFGHGLTDLISDPTSLRSWGKLATPNKASDPSA